MRLHQASSLGAHLVVDLLQGSFVGLLDVCISNSQDVGNRSIRVGVEVGAEVFHIGSLVFCPTRLQSFKQLRENPVDAPSSNILVRQLGGTETGLDSNAGIVDGGLCNLCSRGCDFFALIAYNNINNTNKNIFYK